MAKFKPYPKIHRLGKDETEGILDLPVTVQEKVDGANISVWLEDGVLKCGSRTRKLPDDESFNGFTQYVKENKSIEKWLKDHPTKRLYGEWLVKHTITYPDSAYKKIYLFDVFDEQTGRYESQLTVEAVANRIGVEYPKIFVEDAIITEDQIKEFVGKTLIPEAANGEGVVIKRNFKNKFGDHSYAKIVHESFKEANAIVFGGNNKHSESYWEMYVVNKYCTLGRVQKIMNKMQPEIDHKLDMKETPQVAGRCVHDMITEEAWEIFNKIPSINNKKLKGFATRKFIQIYHDILNNSVSIADGGKDGQEEESVDNATDADIGSSR